jgi:hypothetical protein
MSASGVSAFFDRNCTKNCYNKTFATLYVALFIINIVGITTGEIHPNILAVGTMSVLGVHGLTLIYGVLKGIKKCSSGEKGSGMFLAWKVFQFVVIAGFFAFNCHEFLFNSTPNYFILTISNVAACALLILEFLRKNCRAEIGCGGPPGGPPIHDAPTRNRGINLTEEQRKFQSSLINQVKVISPKLGGFEREVPSEALSLDFGGGVRVGGAKNAIGERIEFILEGVRSNPSVRDWKFTYRVPVQGLSDRHIVVVEYQSKA